MSETEIEATAAILDQTKILLDLLQGPIIGHKCAQYEQDPLTPVLELAAEWFSYVKYREIPIC